MSIGRFADCKPIICLTLLGECFITHVLIPGAAQEAPMFVVHALVAAGSPTVAPSTDSPTTVPSTIDSTTGASLQPSSSPSTTQPVPIDHIDAGWAFFVAVVLAVASLLIGSLIIVARRGVTFGRLKIPPRSATADNAAAENDETVVRAWLAVTLTVGILVFACMTLALDDAQLRGTLIGGLVASAGSAVAFYFASKSADRARQDILGAVFPGRPTTVPDLDGATVASATALAGAANLTLVVHPTGGTGKVVTQVPEAHAAATNDRVVHVLVVDDPALQGAKDGGG